MHHSYNACMSFVDVALIHKFLQLPNEIMQMEWYIYTPVGFAYCARPNYSITVPRTNFNCKTIEHTVVVSGRRPS